MKLQKIKQVNYNSTIAKKTYEKLLDDTYTKKVLVKAHNKDAEVIDSLELPIHNFEYELEIEETNLSSLSFGIAYDYILQLKKLDDFIKKYNTTDITISYNIIIKHNNNNDCFLNMLPERHQIFPRIDDVCVKIYYSDTMMALDKDTYRKDV